MKRTAICAAALGMLLALTASAFAQGGRNLQDVTFGETWMGDDWDVAELKGRVVVVEIWGYN
jgi:hypothetical protein